MSLEGKEMNDYQFDLSDEFFDFLLCDVYKKLSTADITDFLLGKGQ